MMGLLAGLVTILRYVGFALIITGLWFSAGGMRVVVSGRIDERKKSTRSLKRGLGLLLVGVAMLIGSAALR